MVEAIVVENGLVGCSPSCVRGKRQRPDSISVKGQVTSDKVFALWLLRLDKVLGHTIRTLDCPV